MSEMYDEDQPWHLTQEPKGQPSYEELADRIEELEADRRKTYEALLKVTRIHDEVEAKLAKAMTTLECYAGYWADDKTFIRTDDGGELASETIKELKGGKDDNS